MLAGGKLVVVVAGPVHRTVCAGNVRAVRARARGRWVRKACGRARGRGRGRARDNAGCAGYGGALLLLLLAGAGWEITNYVNMSIAVDGRRRQCARTPRMQCRCHPPPAPPSPPRYSRLTAEQPASGNVDDVQIS